MIVTGDDFHENHAYAITFHKESLTEFHENLTDGFVAGDRKLIEWRADVVSTHTRFFFYFVKNDQVKFFCSTAFC